ncbi:nuclear transport factor 2 family protein [Leptolyngbya sp. BC1307]|uniref:nuclear transport factor 2 family protein n=1 Tax=Leptolyngbya sp. BC1307 TaxID=2029589 RepID=UPI001F0AC285|nr:nuclear transport factor 2 family protein [Leptolyngbya sp. BC1307]
MTHRQHWFADRLNWPKPWQLASALTCGLALSLGSGLTAKAASPETAPADLVSTLEQIATAATAGDVTAVMQGYSPSFTNEDGFTYETLQTALQTLWESYDSLTYRVELQSWEPVEGGGYTAETVTYINGTQTSSGRPAQLESVIRSQQTFADGKIVAQTTLSERNQLTSGDNPPTVSVILPEQVKTGETYDFDAIVAEPLGDRYLLGAAVEEGSTAQDFFTGRPVELELLAAGGLFKVGEAPANPDTRWVSALLVSDDGITVVTRRLRVEE